MARSPSRSSPRAAWRLLTLAAAVLAVGVAHGAAAEPPLPGDDLVVQAREALRKKDMARVVQLRTRLPEAHGLGLWLDYWMLTTRLPEVQQADLDAFYARWGGTYVEDRLRNDWLLELGRRRDWHNFRVEFPRFRMNDDREVTCYALLTQHLDGRDVRDAAAEAWYAQRDADDGCHLMATTLADAGRFGPSEVWTKVRLAVEADRSRAARTAATLLGVPVARAVADAIDQPRRLLKSRPGSMTAQQRELALVALMALADDDPEAAADELGGKWERSLGAAQAALAWAAAGKQAAMKLSPQAADYYERGWKRQRDAGTPPAWSDEMLAWSVRAALRTARMDGDRWAMVAWSIDAMSARERDDPAWQYWNARAALARAKPGVAGEADRQAARQRLELLAGTVGFYGHLAAQDLSRPLALPATATAPTDLELAAAKALPGLQRGLHLARIGLRDEGRREWNWTLRGMNDRELIAAAQLACDVGDWQLCINTSERTKAEIHLNQRYPMPFGPEITASATARGLEPAFVFGLIRQETRFMPSLRSSAGASGLMQLMPATARWTARKLGIDFRSDQINDVDTNLKLGTTYLKMVLDDFAGSQALATAAYNAGPGRPRRWREGPVLHPAVWAENIPFNETRDYVKRVLANASIYAALIAGANQAAPLAQRLGTLIGPRDAAAPAGDRDLP